MESGVYLDTKHVLSEGHGDPQGLQGGQWNFFLIERVFCSKLIIIMVRKKIT